MHLNAKKLGLAGGIVWGFAMLITVLFGLWMGYGLQFLGMMASIYPGLEVSYLGALIGLAYGFVDGFIGLYIIAWIYNKL